MRALTVAPDGEPEAFVFTADSGQGIPPVGRCWASSGPMSDRTSATCRSPARARGRSPRLDARGAVGDHPLDRQQPGHRERSAGTWVNVESQWGTVCAEIDGAEQHTEAGPGARALSV